MITKSRYQVFLKCYYNEKMLFSFSVNSDFIFGKNAPCQLFGLLSHSRIFKTEFFCSPLNSSDSIISISCSNFSSCSCFCGPSLVTLTKWSLEDKAPKIRFKRKQKVFPTACQMQHDFISNKFSIYSFHHNQALAPQNKIK